MAAARRGPGITSFSMAFFMSPMPESEECERHVPLMEKQPFSMLRP